MEAVKKKTSTTILIDEFCEHSDLNLHNTATFLKGGSLEAYEKLIGKNLISMNTEDIYEYIMGYRVKNDNGSVSDYLRFVKFFDHFFDWYRRTVDHKCQNPMNVFGMRGKEPLKRYVKENGAFTYEKLKNCFLNNHYHTSNEFADYIEYTCLMFYSGVKDASELRDLRTNNVNQISGEMYLPGRSCIMTERCLELYQYFDMQHSIFNGRESLSLIPYRGSAYKFCVRPHCEDAFDDRSEINVKDMINKLIKKHIADRYNIQIDAKKIFYLGFYDHLVRRYGKEKTQMMVWSNNYKSAVKILEMEFYRYGIEVKSASNVKLILSLFCEAPD